MSKSETLFDALQMEASKKKSALGYLDPILRRARCFVLDDGMSAFLADLSTRAFHDAAAKLSPEWHVTTSNSGVTVNGTNEQIKSLIKRLHAIGNGLRVTAKAPHAVTWIEFNFHARYERYLRSYSAHGAVGDEFIKNHRTRYALCGWLIEQLGEEEYQCTAVMGDRNGTMEITPYHYVWSTDDKPVSVSDSKRIKFSPSLTLSESDDEYDEMPEAISSRMAFGTPALVGLSEIVQSPLTRFLPIDLVLQTMTEMRGELRYVWSLLASINDLPIGIRKVERSRGFMGRNSYRKFMAHSVITLVLPKRMTEKRLARVIVAISRRRAHEVRGHFRLVGADKKRVWIKEHVRGDASLGWVTHNYLVKHEREDA